MILLIKFKHAYYRIIFGVRDFFVVHNYAKSSKDELTECCSGESLSLADDFYYKDETWGPVNTINELLLAASMHKDIQAEDNQCNLLLKGKIKNDALIVDTQRLQNNWLCFFYNKSLMSEYVFGFDIVIHTEFKEIQIAFQYKNLANRLRFLIRDNQEAAFEIIRSGIFYRHVCSIPYSLKLDTTHHIVMEMRKRQYRFIIDGKPLIAVKQLAETKFTGNQLCLILYNDSADSAINCTISNLFLSNICRD